MDFYKEIKEYTYLRASRLLPFASKPNQQKFAHLKPFPKRFKFLICCRFISCLLCHLDLIPPFKKESASSRSVFLFHRTNFPMKSKRMAAYCLLIFSNKYAPSKRFNCNILSEISSSLFIYGIND